MYLKSFPPNASILNFSFDSIVVLNGREINQWKLNAIFVSFYLRDEFECFIGFGMLIFIRMKLQCCNKSQPKHEPSHSTREQSKAMSELCAYPIGDSVYGSHPSLHPHRSTSKTIVQTQPTRSVEVECSGRHTLRMRYQSANTGISKAFRR